MKRWIIISIFMGVLFIVLYIINKPTSQPEQQDSPKIPQNTKTKVLREDRNRDDIPPEQEEIALDPVEPVPRVETTADRAQIFEEIDEAVLTYDAQSVKIIAPYLLHQDPEIRKMAVDGLLRAGDSSATPLLREALEKLSDLEEKIVYRDAANYLEQPDFKGFPNRGNQ